MVASEKFNIPESEMTVRQALDKTDIIIRSFLFLKVSCLGHRPDLGDFYFFKLDDDFTLIYKEEDAIIKHPGWKNYFGSNFPEVKGYDNWYIREI